VYFVQVRLFNQVIAYRDKKTVSLRFSCAATSAR
jgi:hypothetical protein